MTKVTIEEAGAKLHQLVDEAAHGEEILITRENRPIVKLVPVADSEHKAKPRFGSAKHMLIHMSDDFDAPLEDFKEYME